MVELIKQTTEEERAGYLEEAQYNPFLIKAENILIDFLTDSDTGGNERPAVGRHDARR